MGPVLTSPAQHALRAIERYDALAAGGFTALDAYLACFDPSIEMTASIGGITVRTSGPNELRSVNLNSLEAGMTHRHLSPVVTCESREAATVAYEFLILEHGYPVGAVAAETEFAVRDGLITRMGIRERARGTACRPVWAPLGPTLSVAGEIVWRGEDHLLVKLYNGRAMQFESPKEVTAEWEVGDPVMVFFEGDRPLGWYLPDRQLGVDLRG